MANCPNCGEKMFIYDRHHRVGPLVKFVTWAVCKVGWCDYKMPVRIVVLSGEERMIKPPYTNRGVTSPPETPDKVE